jgi:GTP diphosphokinase / guanosine-3',5'-bis(diphosphate) 3'-diphosphatase
MGDEEVIDEAIKQLLLAAQKRFRNEHVRLIGTAAYYAAKAHEGQERKSGGPYILHPLRAAQHLLALEDDRVDVAAMCAALLHDALEDTDMSASQIESRFGRDVTSLVQTLTKKKPADKTRKEQDEEYFKQLVRYERSDPRVALIKLADIYDNAQTISVHSSQRKKQRVKNLEEFYAPLAQRLEHPQLAKELLAIAAKNKD